MKIACLAIAASAVMLAAPAFAATKADRTAGRVAEKHAAASMHRVSPAPILSGTDWDARVGFDRASSPFGHGGY